MQGSHRYSHRMHLLRLWSQGAVGLFLVAGVGCSSTPAQSPVSMAAEGDPTEGDPAAETSSVDDPDELEEPDTEASTNVADVVGVMTTGEPGSAQVSVTLQSPDLGCEQYADWWEVLDESGALIYRRILTHSHVNEQPFTRSGGPVALEADQTVFVRAHMYPGGYGGQVMTGSIAAGFEVATILPDIDEALEQASPQPNGCAF